MASICAIHRFNDATVRPVKRVHSTSVIDPLGKRRAQLTSISRLLVKAARRLEVSAPLHPIASILRGMALHTRQDLSRVGSLRPASPAALTTMLTMVATLFAGPRTMDAYQYIANYVGAFDDQGNPMPELRVAATGKWKAFTNRMLELLETYARLFAAAWGLFLLAASIYLLATGRLGLNNIQFEK
ncbi:hypothetical protein AB0L70_35910 [Kribbella sp. NPDC051952]|uniref:hypothetical protein n=1 Tax=Kribbella sp. NPDC051952 TaxID=3154851 RepID=UPI003421EFA0